MTGILDLELGDEPLERSKVDLVVAGIFIDELPLRGGAGRVDWRLCGLVSDQILAGRIRGARGEALLIPSTGQLRSNRVMVLGLGVRSKYKLELIAKSVQQAVSRATALASPSIAMAPLGIAGDEFPRCAEAIVAGAVAGFEASTASLRLRIVLPPAEVNRGVQAVAAYLGTVATPKLRFQRKSGRISSSQTSRARSQELAAPHRSPR
ncbi:MAG: hypothetical protein IH881_07760 [Myxococcales bacterium]|nr:hypothetical protein [Myxococcales bacterium]MCH7867580.1 hypothetical protein [Myxococcales bacterium]